MLPQHAIRITLNDPLGNTLGVIETPHDTINVEVHPPYSDTSPNKIIAIRLLDFVQSRGWSVYKQNEQIVKLRESILRYEDVLWTCNDPGPLSIEVQVSGFSSNHLPQSTKLPPHSTEESKQNSEVFIPNGRFKRWLTFLVPLVLTVLLKALLDWLMGLVFPHYPPKGGDKLGGSPNKHEL